MMGDTVGIPFTKQRHYDSWIGRTVEIVEPVTGMHEGTIRDQGKDPADYKDHLLGEVGTIVSVVPFTTMLDSDRDGREIHDSQPTLTVNVRGVLADCDVNEVRFT